MLNLTDILKINKKKSQYFNNHIFCDKKIHQWVSQEIQDTREDQQVAECLFIKRKELSKKQDQFLILSL
jgi:hypothetical protein